MYRAVCSVRSAFLLADQFCFRKITMDPYIIAHVNTERPDGRHTKLNIYVSELATNTHN